MGSFGASLKTPGDRSGLPATLHLEEGRLSIAAGEQSIGDWSLEDISLERMPSGYRMTAEGEELLLEIVDVKGFEDELSESSRKPRSLPGKETLPALLDGALAGTEKKLGSLLPPWVFTRGMALGLVGVLILAILLPRLVARILLFTGVLVVLFGSVVHTDDLLASRWLPGRTTPGHVLVSGVGILLIGVVLALVAN